MIPPYVSFVLIHECCVRKLAYIIFVSEISSNFLKNIRPGNQIDRILLVRCIFEDLIFYK